MNEEDIKQWRLILGQDEQDTQGTDGLLNANEELMDKTLSAVYGAEEGEDALPRKKEGSLSNSSPHLAKWLANVRNCFPASAVQIIQRDAIERLHLTTLLTEKEVLDNVVPDVHLLSTLIALNGAIPERNKAAVRVLVGKIVEQLRSKIQWPLLQAVSGALKKNTRKRNPRLNEIDWNATILKNLKNYQPDYHTIIPEVKIGLARRQKRHSDVFVCIDESGSMESSLIYSAVFGSVLAGLSSISTHLVAFGSDVVDLTEKVSDPVEVLLGVQLGGGTDIGKALAYCRQQISNPLDSILFLITDLYDGYSTQGFLHHVAALVDAGVQLIVLTALSDDGSPDFNRTVAAQIAAYGVPVFGCTPDAFPEVMGKAINRESLI